MNIKDFFTDINNPNGSAIAIYNHLYRSIFEPEKADAKETDVLAIVLLCCHYISSLASSHGFTVKIAGHSNLNFNNKFFSSCPTSSLLLWDNGHAVRQMRFSKTGFEEIDLAVFHNHKIFSDGILIADSTYCFESFFDSPTSIAGIQTFDSGVSSDDHDLIDLIPDGWEAIYRNINSLNTVIYLRKDSNAFHLPSTGRYVDQASDITPRAQFQRKTIGRIEISMWKATRFYSSGNAAIGKVNNSFEFSYFDAGVRSGPTTSSFVARPSILAVTDAAYVSGTSIVWKESSFIAELSSCHDPQPVEGFYEVSGDPTALYKSAFVLATANPHHSHWLLESVQHLHWLDKINDPNVCLIVSSLTTPSQREYLQVFLQNRFEIIYKHPHETIFADRVYSIPNAGLYWTQDGINYLRGLSAVLSRATLNKNIDRIYISRSDSKVYRNLINENEIEAIFRKSGFTIYRASELSVIDKICVFANARILAGPIGAGLHYACFSANDLVVGFITPPHYRPIELLSLNGYNTKITSVLINATSLFQIDNWGGSHSSFYIDPETARRFLDVYC